MPRIGVLIADEHAILRAGIRALIDAQPDMRVVGEAGDGRELLRIAREIPADVVLAQLGLPGCAGMEAVERTLRQRPRAKVLVLAPHGDPAHAGLARAAGASGWVVSTATAGDLLSAIRAAHRGHSFAGTTGRRPRGPAANASSPAAGPPTSLLSPREREVLGLLVRGHTNREIAQRIRVSIKTGETYRARLGDKLGLRRRSEFVRYGLDTGLLSPGEPGRDEDRD